MSRTRALLAASLIANLVAVVVLGVYVASVGVGEVLEKAGLRDPDKPDYGALAQDRFAGLPGADVVVLGDSLVQDGPFGELVGKSARRGIGGATIADVTAMVPFSLKATTGQVLVIAGVNDVLQDHNTATVEDDARGLVQAIGEVAPDAEVVWLEVLAPEGMSDQAAEVNAGIEAAATDDTFETFAADGVLSADGDLEARFTYDGTHLNPTGYAEIGGDLRAALAQDAG